LPTFEHLQDRSGLKVAALRVRLRDVRRFKCSDNTVRYDETEAAAAIGEVDEPEIVDLDEEPAAATLESLPSDPVQAALQVMNRTLALFSVVVKERGEIVKLCNETIKTMAEPLKLGQELVREGVGVMRDRLKHYDEMWDGMILLVEDLQSTRDARQRAAVQQVERAAFRKETFQLAKDYVPAALEKFQLTAEAQLALDLIGGIDPAALGPIVEHAVPEALQPKARRLVELLKQRRAPAAPGPVEAPPAAAAEAAQ
jgi:hypothetical protein